jgi:predicted nucleic acid-binding protein
MNYLLDTCVLSEYIKKPPNIQVIQWVDEQSEASLFISVLTLAELKKGNLPEDGLKQMVDLANGLIPQYK